MRDRIRIRRTTPDAWVVVLPRIGFGPPEVLACASQADGIAVVDRIRAASRRHGSTVAGQELHRAQTDCLFPISPWTPLWIPGTEPAVLPYSHGN